MNLAFRKAKRSSLKPLIGIYAESGCGKTWSALMLARGFVGPSGRIGMIETEAGRGEAYADILAGGYDVLSLADDFSPRAYGAAITAAEDAKLDALIVDSASHEWEGTGGVLHMAAMNIEAGKKSLQVWQTPKMDHARHFMLRLLQTSIPLVIVCMRAKYPMVEQVNPKTGKKEMVRSEQLEPKQSEDILYELFVHGWIDREHRFHATKYTRPDLAQVIKSGEPIGIATGEALARWAAGGKASEAAHPPAAKAGDAAEGAPSPAAPAEPGIIDLLGEITAAKTLRELNKVYERLKASPPKGPSAPAVQEAYAQKLAELKAAAPEPGSRG